MYEIDPYGDEANERPDVPARDQPTHVPLSDIVIGGDDGDVAEDPPADEPEVYPEPPSSSYDDQTAPAAASESMETPEPPEWREGVDGWTVGEHKIPRLSSEDLKRTELEMAYAAKGAEAVIPYLTVEDPVPPETEPFDMSTFPPVEPGSSDAERATEVRREAAVAAWDKYADFIDAQEGKLSALILEANTPQGKIPFRIVEGDTIAFSPRGNDGSRHDYTYTEDTDGVTRRLEQDVAKIMAGTPLPREVAPSVYQRLVAEREAEERPNLEQEVAMGLNALGVGEQEMVRVAELLEQAEPPRVSFAELNFEIGMRLHMDPAPEDPTVPRGLHAYRNPQPAEAASAAEDYLAVTRAFMRRNESDMLTDNVGPNNFLEVQVQEVDGSPMVRMQTTQFPTQEQNEIALQAGLQPGTSVATMDFRITDKGVLIEMVVDTPISRMRSAGVLATQADIRRLRQFLRDPRLMRS